MKKNIFCLVLVAALVLTITSCGGDVKTNTELLTIEKGWVLSAATSSPAYALSNGSFATDLMKDGYLYECELDDVIKFAANGSQLISPAANICDDGYQAEVAATWTFNEDETVLNMQIPFFYSDDYTTYSPQVENPEILSLNENELRLKYTFTDEENPAKGTYSFTLTYVPAK